MRLLFCLMVCEKDWKVAHSTIERLGEVMGPRKFDVLLFDDASPSRVGDRLVAHFAGKLPAKISVVRAEHSKGYYRLIENLMVLFGVAAQSSEPYDMVIRIDPDIHIVSNSFGSFFDQDVWPRQGIVSLVFQSRWRDFVQFFNDISPVGFRRKRVNGVGMHAWQFAGFRRVWWAWHGWRALFRGYWRQVTPGAFMAVPWATLQEMKRRGMFEQSHEEMGLIFGDDLIFGILVKSLGHPIVNIRDLLPQFRWNLWLRRGQPLESIQARDITLLHPLKDDPWSHQVRAKIRAA